ncbi:multivesicular body subunit 12B-like [Ciona intestinalis]
MSQNQPITNVCIVAERNACPPRYNILDRTIENEDADFWKDGLFKSKTRRYLCFTREPSQNQLNEVITDMALIGVKDPVPIGYTALKETADTREQALKKHNLCIRYIPKTSTSSAISDILLCRDNSYKERMYTLMGELNGINVAFKLSTINIPANRPAPPPPVQRMNTTAVNTPPPMNDTIQRNHTQQQHNVMSGIEGVEWKLHDRFTQTKAGMDSKTALNIEIRSRSELIDLCAYDFTKEKSILYSC